MNIGDFDLSESASPEQVDGQAPFDPNEDGPIKRPRTTGVLHKVQASIPTTGPLMKLDIYNACIIFHVSARSPFVSLLKRATKLVESLPPPSSTGDAIGQHGEQHPAKLPAERPSVRERELLSASALHPPQTKRQRRELRKERQTLMKKYKSHRKKAVMLVGLSRAIDKTVSLGLRFKALGYAVSFTTDTVEVEDELEAAVTAESPTAAADAKWKVVKRGVSCMRVYISPRPPILLSVNTQLSDLIPQTL
ncbi:uncharacterized protein V1518DRAFT_414799 [Limtongia smithiae]|uniref:uncharacterized protein n=1 Tax=Limtongia smithiae TaxID=1125753 RepID=UPI0034CF10A5